MIFFKPLALTEAEKRELAEIQDIIRRMEKISGRLCPTPDPAFCAIIDDLARRKRLAAIESASRN